MAITRVAIEKALAGDSLALRLVLGRIVPPRKSRPVRVAPPSIKTAFDVVSACFSHGLVGNGLLAPDEGATIAALLDLQRKALETYEIELRLQALEQSVPRWQPRI